MEVGPVEVLNPSTLQWWVASAPLPGEVESGDRYVVRPHAYGVLVGVIDALGHGSRAAQGAAPAVDTLLRYPQDGVAALMARCHGVLRQECGAAMGLASFDWRAGQISWLGIGNVAGVLVRPSGTDAPHILHLLVRGGVVGGDLPQLEPTTLALVPGDTLIMATDGIAEGFADELPSGLAPQALAEDIFRRYAKSTDDALVLVARYSGVRDEQQGPG